MNTNRRDIVPYGSWERFYERWPIEDQPWYSEGLDKDLSSWLAARPPESLRILDVGTGVGTQAIALAEDGHDVLGTDLSQIAIADAKETEVKKTSKKTSVVQPMSPIQTPKP